jgi:hypothetical protein
MQQMQARKHKKTAQRLSIVLYYRQTAEVELYKKAGYAAAAANKANGRLTKFFDSLGSHLEEFGTNIANSILAPQTTIIHAGLTSIKIQENTARTAFKQLFVGIAQDLGHMLMESLGKSIAKALTGGASNTISEMMSKLFSKAFSSVGDMAANALGKTATSAAGSIAGDAGSKAITTAITTSAVQTATGMVTQTTTTVTSNTANTALVTGSIATASAAQVAAMTALFLKPEVAGTTFAGGGIVSAAGGMMVGGTQRAILHDREMVLPKHISEGLQNAITSGSFNRGGNSQTANLNYSPSIQMARGRSGTGMSKAELSKMMAMHSGSMMGQARNMMRNGWRP